MGGGLVGGGPSAQYGKLLRDRTLPSLDNASVSHNGQRAYNLYGKEIVQSALFKLGTMMDWVLKYATLTPLLISVNLL